MTEATIWVRTPNAAAAKRKTRILIREIVSPRNTKSKRVFFAYFANYYLQLQYAAFLSKAKTGGDEWDESWNELNPKTVADKRRLGVEHPEWINVRTGRLLEAFKPLTQVGGRLYARKDMQIQIQNETISFVVTVPYSDRVDRVRSLFVLAEELIDRAAEKALIETLRQVLPSERL